VKVRVESRSLSLSLSVSPFFPFFLFIKLHARTHEDFSIPDPRNNIVTNRRIALSGLSTESHSQVHSRPFGAVAFEGDAP